jgi:hypothetical protein
LIVYVIIFAYTVLLFKKMILLEGDNLNSITSLLDLEQYGSVPLNATDVFPAIVLWHYTKGYFKFDDETQRFIKLRMYQHKQDFSRGVFDLEEVKHRECELRDFSRDKTSVDQFETFKRGGMTAYCIDDLSSI